ncbi:hypothetical protein L596_001981 [Steinernema carpocapsae]|uniref:Uncharacterized protein n=1 Tax=Steinernema carpocapsae TaxID=34508 RepID=A0A4U8UNB8_STECR|nr:hypothetical protein L596_001981 [Steinernema carpocapsae]
MYRGDASPIPQINENHVEGVNSPPTEAAAELSIYFRQSPGNVVLGPIFRTECTEAKADHVTHLVRIPGCAAKKTEIMPD